LSFCVGLEIENKIVDSIAQKSKDDDNGKTDVGDCLVHWFLFLVK